MDEIEIRVYEEITDYKEKIYFLNVRQWIFAIIIVALVVPVYLLLKTRIGEEITSYIVILIAIVFGFIGFVKIHELEAEKILPYWVRNYLFFTKPIQYVSDQEFELQKQNKKKKSNFNKTQQKYNKKEEQKEIKAKKKEIQQEKILAKAKKKYCYKENNIDTKNENMDATEELSKKLTSLTKEQQEVLLKLFQK